MNFLSRAANLTAAMLLGCLALVLALPSTTFAQTPQKTLIDFEQISGPQLFSTVSPPITISSVTFSGGQVLTNATNDPADPTSSYGTASFCTGCLSTITISFQQKASNVSFLLINGQTVTVTYTVVDDLGGSKQITLVSNLNAGAGTVAVPDNGIKQITITPVGISSWDFLIDNLSFSATSVQMIDPVQSGYTIQYPGGAVVSTNTDLLATGGTPVIGAAADGVAQIVVRIPSATAGTTYNLSLLNENGGADTVAADGGFFALGAKPSTAAQTISVTSINTSQGPVAFALYVPPVDFARTSADNNLVSRNLTINVATGGATTSTTPLSLVRPPVMLVHGLWGSAADWNTFTDVTTDPLKRFTVSRIDYSGAASGVTNTTPSYTTFFSVKKNSIGFDYNAPAVDAAIRANIASYRTNSNVAVVQADVIGHSMGGDISRNLVLQSGYLNGNTYGAGPIHKLIEIGTPNLGSLLATDLLAGNSNCSRGILAQAGLPAFTSLTINNVSVSGAVNDLVGLGDGTGLSAALTKLSTSVHPFPLAYLAATSTSTNTATLGTKFTSQHIASWCGTSDVIASALTPTGWPALFNGAPSDSVVSLNSQFNGNPSAAALTVSGVIHSAGLLSLDFTGPPELDHTSGLGVIAVKVLNESAAGPDFYGKGTK